MQPRLVGRVAVQVQVVLVGDLRLVEAVQAQLVLKVLAVFLMLVAEAEVALKRKMAVLH
jgi:hypothetical protein